MGKPLQNKEAGRNMEEFTMSDLAATNCGCGNDGCGLQQQLWMRQWKQPLRR